MVDAVNKLLREAVVKKNPIFGEIAAVSVGMYEGEAVLDLDYLEDSAAQTDMNVVMNATGDFIEVQGTAEAHAFKRDEMNQMLDLAELGIEQLLVTQRCALRE